MPISRRFLVGGALVTVAALVAALTAGGGAPTPTPDGLPDPGPIVGWGLSLAKLLSDCAATAVVGFLLLAAFLLPSKGTHAEGLAVDAVQLARRAAWVWAAATAALYVLVAADIAGVPLHGLRPGTLGALATEAVLGRLILVQAALAAVLAAGLRWTLSLRSLAAWLALATPSLTLLAFTGHSAVIGAHDVASMAMVVHLIAVAYWVGGLAALGWLSTTSSKRFAAARARYSILAGWCFALVGISGLLSAVIRLSALSDLVTSGYGQLVLAKTMAFGVLGAIAWRQRRRVSAFAALVGVELLVMGATMGLAVGLARTPGIGNGALTTPAQDLLGGVMPPAPTAWRLLTAFEPSGVGFTIVGLGAALYLRGVWTLRRRGDAWPMGRTVAWLIGLVVVGWATFGGLGEYSHVLFSAHMVAHMLLSMVAPIFLVLGAPITLALRTLPGPRGPGEVSPRAMLISLLASRPVKVLTHPVVGPVIFVGSLYGLYFTSAFDTFMRGLWGHGLMQLHFLAVGMLFYYVVIGIDPSPRSLPSIARFGVLMVTIPFHAFFSIAVMSATGIFAETYWRMLDRPYRTDLLADQYLGGGISWALGELPLILVMGALFVQWIRSDAREARRLDRLADRDGDAELTAYNERLAQLNRRPN